MVVLTPPAYATSAHDGCKVLGGLTPIPSFPSLPIPGIGLRPFNYWHPLREHLFRHESVIMYEGRVRRRFHTKYVRTTWKLRQGFATKNQDTRTRRYFEVIQ